jgi:hypothetical protein
MGTKYGKGHWRKSKDAVTNSYDGEYIEDKKNGLGDSNLISLGVWKCLQRRVL